MGGSLPPMVEDNVQPWGKKAVEDYREIVLKAIERCREEGSKQMIKGISNVAILNPETKEWERVNLEDQRKIFKEAINTLYDLLLFYFDDKLKNKLKEISTNRKNKLNELIEKYIEVESDPQNKRLALQTKTFVSSSKIGKHYEEAWEKNNHNFDRQMFQQLLLLFKRKNDLRSKMTISPY